MRPTLLLLPALLVSTLAVAQAPAKPTTAPAKSAPAAAPLKLPAASPPPLTDANFPTPEQLAELTCANEYNFTADKVGENRFALRLDTQSAACKSAKRTVQWKFSGDDGITFVDLTGPNEYVRTLKPVAQGVEIEVIPDARFFAIGSVPIMDGVNADGPVLAFGVSEFDLLQAPPAAPVQQTAAKKP